MGISKWPSDPQFCEQKKWLETVVKCPPPIIVRFISDQSLLEYLYILHSIFFQIIADTISPFYIIFLFLRTSYYPLKDLFGDYGEGMCHFYDYLLVIGAFAGQFHSFFLTAFRYICLFHDDFMLRYNIQPKVRYLIVNLSFLKSLFKTTVIV